MNKPQFDVELLKELAFDTDETAANGCGNDCIFNSAINLKPKQSIFKIVD